MYANVICIIEFPWLFGICLVESSNAFEGTLSALLDSMEVAEWVINLNNNLSHHVSKLLNTLEILSPALF